MIKQFSSLALAAALAAPAVWADRAERAERSRAETARLTSPAPTTDAARALVRAKLRGSGPGLRANPFNARAASTEKRAETQAPGVIQINLFDSAREAYFVVTRTIPAGSTVQAFIILPAPADQKQEWALESLRVDGDLQPGFSLVLPGIRTLGDFWKQGLTTYTVVVTDPGGVESTSSTDWTAGGYFRNVEDTSFMVPGIDSWREFINGDGATIVEIKGRFLTGVRTEVVFEDIVSPQEAIEVVDSTTIRVNVSRVPNFDLTLMKTYLLTVGQDSWTDIAHFRHTPH